jgi:hypothetical protein
LAALLVVAQALRLAIQWVALPVQLLAQALAAAAARHSAANSLNKIFRGC